MATRSNRRGLAWAIIGGLVLLVGIAALIIASLSTRDAPEPTPTATSSATAPTANPTEDTEQEVVDDTAADRGWVPEPITTDAATYVEAALAAGGTFDTTKAEYEDWITYLGTWFTPDTR